MFCGEKAIPLFSKDLFVAWYVPGTVFSAGDRAMNRLNPGPHEAYILLKGGETDNN